MATFTIALALAELFTDAELGPEFFLGGVAILSSLALGSLSC
jgi:hypothetical protein